MQKGGSREEGEANAEGSWVIEAIAKGESFDLRRHPQGTEVKAITYSNMQVYDRDDTRKRAELFVIIDI